MKREIAAKINACIKETGLNEYKPDMLANAAHALMQAGMASNNKDAEKKILETVARLVGWLEYEP